MNNTRWQSLIRKLTGEYNLTIDHVPDPTNHLGITVNFYLRQSIDDASKKLLDIGASKNYVRQEIAAQWTGVDIVGATDVIEADAHELPFEDASFDIVFSSHMLEHVLSPAICVSEMKRVVRDEGSIIIGVPLYPGFMSVGHIYMMPAQSWELLFRQQGLVCVSFGEERDCGCFHLRKQESLRGW